MRPSVLSLVAAALFALSAAGPAAAETPQDSGQPTTPTPPASAAATPASTAAPSASAAAAAPANTAAPPASAAAATPANTAAPAASAAPPAPASGAKVQRIKSGPHIEVHARDLRLGDTQKERLFRIAERYFKATKKKLVITGGSRSAQRQAELMIAKLKKGEDFAKLYENRSAAVEIAKVYKEGVAKRLSEKALIDAIRRKIEAQMAAGNFVSKHLKAGAADVRSRDMKPAQEKALRAAVAAEPGVSLVDERQSVEPHFHLGL